MLDLAILGLLKEQPLHGYELKKRLGRHPGDSPVLLHIGERQVLRLPAAWTVSVGPALLGELRELLGPSAILS